MEFWNCISHPVAVMRHCEYVISAVSLQGGGHCMQGGGWSWERRWIQTGSELPEHQVQSYVECSESGWPLVPAGCLLGGWDSGHGQQILY